MATIFRAPLRTAIPAPDPAGVAVRALPTGANPLLLLLAGQDQQFGAPGQFQTYDWPNPSLGAPYPSALRFWSQSLNQTTLFVTPAPGSQQDWPNPGLGKPYPVVNRGWLGQVPLNLLGQDTFFDGAGRAPVYDWPNPRGAAYPSTNRGSVLGLPLHLLVPQGGFFTHEWPNPRGASYPSHLRTHLDPLRLNLLGQDLFFGEPGQGPAYAWPNPGLGRPYPVALRTLTGHYKLLEQPVPFYQTDHPNPSAGRPYPVALRSWLAELKQNLLGQDRLYGTAGEVPSYDWTNPRIGPPYPVGLRGWTVPLNLLIQPAGPGTFFVYDTPLPPAGRAFPVALRGFHDPLKLLLYGKDVQFGAPGEVIAYDWPNPSRGAPYPSALRTFLQPVSLLLLGQDRLYGGPGQVPSYDWPNPGVPRFLVTLRGQVSYYPYTEGGSAPGVPIPLPPPPFALGAARALAFLDGERAILLLEDGRLIEVQLLGGDRALWFP
jgi:hypothetical protein